MNTNDINQQVDNKIFDEFCLKCEEAHQSKHHKVDKIMKTINEKISFALNQELSKSELENMNIDDVISVIKRKI